MQAMALAAPSGHPTRCSQAQFNYAAGWVGSQEPRLGRYTAILEGLRLDSGTLVLVGWESAVPRLWLPTDISQPQSVAPTPPHPRPRNVFLLSSPPPQGQAPRGCYGPASHSGSPGGGVVGRSPGFPPPSFHPREKFLRGPLRHWVPKITLRGKGGCEGRGSGRSAESSCGVLQVSVGSKPKERRPARRLGTLTNPWGPGSSLIRIESFYPSATPRVGRKPLG